MPSALRAVTVVPDSSVSSDCALRLAPNWPPVISLALTRAVEPPLTVAIRRNPVLSLMTRLLVMVASLVDSSMPFLVPKAVAVMPLSESFDPFSARIWLVAAPLAVRLEPPRTNQLSCAVVSLMVLEPPFSIVESASAHGLINSIGAKVASLSLRASGENEKECLTYIRSLLSLSAIGKNSTCRCFFRSCI
ncbi:hypothetical protein D3C86_1107710 [compost metagenome]